MSLELTRIGLLVELANHYTTRGVHVCVCVCWVDTVEFIGVFFFVKVILNSINSYFFLSLSVFVPLAPPSLSVLIGLDCSWVWGYSFGFEFFFEVVGGLNLQAISG